MVLAAARPTQSDNARRRPWTPVYVCFIMCVLRSVANKQRIPEFEGVMTKIIKVQVVPLAHCHPTRPGNGQREQRAAGISPLAASSPAPCQMDWTRSWLAQIVRAPPDACSAPRPRRRAIARMSTTGRARPRLPAAAFGRRQGGPRKRKPIRFMRAKVLATCDQSRDPGHATRSEVPAGPGPLRGPGPDLCATHGHGASACFRQDRGGSALTAPNSPAIENEQLVKGSNESEIRRGNLFCYLCQKSLNRSEELLKVPCAHNHLFHAQCIKVTQPVWSESKYQVLRNARTKCLLLQCVGAGGFAISTYQMSECTATVCKST